MNYPLQNTNTQNGVKVERLGNRFCMFLHYWFGFIVCHE